MVMMTVIAIVRKRLIQCCRDGSDMGINKGGWKLFYTTVKYHPGTVEVLISNKVLPFAC
jgi:hypothetical protein